jgi:putative membrane protein
MSIKALLIPLAGLLLAACPLVAQEQPGSVAPSAGSLQALDPASFTALAASLAMFEIDAGGHALQAASRPEVVTLARDTVQLHADLLARLRQVAQQQNLVIPETASLEHRAVLDGLTPLAGEELDRRYAESQAQAFEQAVQLYRTAASQDDDPTLKSFATEFLPRLEQQQATVQRLLDTIPP